ncbi:MAG TPA: FG-GAP repeat protein, partial [Polyangiaceae bacterium]|nr:FG-GAP repeat protein [Polyangiaceae bacterium]
DGTASDGDAGTDANAGAGGSSETSTGGTGGSGGSAAASGSGGTAGSAGVSGSAGSGGAPTDAGTDVSTDASTDAGNCDPPADAGCTDSGVTGAQEGYLKTDKSQSGLELGRAIAMDGNTIVAGSAYYPLGSGKNGAVVVYTRDCNGWSLQAVLQPDNAGSQDQFGTSVAVSGDTIVVGAKDEDGPSDAMSNSGAAYVFTRCGAGWTQSAYLRASNAENNDRFGTSVAIDGDVIVVGAREEDSAATGIGGDQTNNAASQAGAAYVFRRGVSGWSQEAYLKASNAEQNDGFGAAVGVSGNTIVVSAVGEDSAATGINGAQGNDPSYIQSGAVYVFTHSGSGWAQQAYIKPSNTGANLSLGESLAIDGDTVVAGSIDETGGSTGVNGDQTTTGLSSGAAYIFFRNAGTWSQQAYVKASNTGANDAFGASVAISGDRVLVGAPQEDSAATGLNGDATSEAANGAGAAYLYTRSAGNWAFSTYVKASNTGIADLFGTAVAVSGSSFAVGAIFEDSGSTGVNGNQSDNSKGNSGALYVFNP